MLSQNQSRCLDTIGFALLALLFASDLLLKPPKELVLLAIDCISAPLLYGNPNHRTKGEEKRRIRRIRRMLDHNHCIILYLTHW